MLSIAAVLLQKGQDVIELGAGVRREQLLQVGVDRLPGGNLYGAVLHARNGLATS